jgi:serine/threonine protein kinase/Tfp pilus assembly protein PilF
MSERLSINSTISHYRIVSKLGAGGMGDVYLAQDTKLDRRVALKILPQEFAADADRMRRFVLEAKSASALNHPNIITIYEIGETEETTFIATEYIEGKTLNNCESLSLTAALDVATQIALALQAAHSAGIVHRDIKPENVMIRPDGLVKILDFGIAKLSGPTAVAGRINKETDPEAVTAVKAGTSAGMIIGTASYMSPEQARGKVIDARSDIFSFGVVLYEMLTGRKAFDGENAMDVIGSIIADEPKPINQVLLELPLEIDRIVNRALRKDREARYQTANDLVNDLKSLQKRLEFEAELERTSPPPKKAEARTQIIRAETTAKTEPQNSIAVLPFANMSNDTENEYFCDGLAEELLNALAKIEDLKVAARTSAFSFKGKHTNVSEIGHALSVKTVLEGSVRKSGSRVRITVQLISAADGYHLWSERYDREMQDIFDVQDEITQAIVDALKLKLFGKEKALVMKRYTDNTEAYELFLKGRYYFNKHAGGGWLKALEYFEQAIEKEPEYAPAYAWISISLTHAWYFGVLSSDEAVPKSKAAANRAREIDNDLAEAHSALGNIHFYNEWDWQKAEHAYKRAIEINPNSADAGMWYGLFLTSRERFDEAINEGSRTVELDPLSLFLNLNVGWIYLFADRLGDTLAQVRRMIEIEPNFNGAYWQLGMVHLLKGRYEEAREEYRKAVALGSYPTTLSILGVACARLGKRDEAFDVLNQLLEMKQQQPVAAFDIARVYGGLDENDKTFEWLEKAVAERNGELVFLNLETKIGTGDMFGKDIRRDPRFQVILRRIGVPTDENAPDKSTNEACDAQTVMLQQTTTDAKETPPAKR